MAKQSDETVQGGGLARQIQPQQVGQLADGNHHRRAEGETEHHRVGDEVHQRAKTQQSQQPLENPRQEGQ
ncbi:hypothetical protein D3C84_1100390 [compost metagenome]